MRNKQYWIDRANRRMDNYTLSAFDTARIINRSYNSLETYIKGEMAKILRHIGDEDSLAYEYRMKRLNALLMNTDKKFKELYGINLTDTTAFLKSIIPEAYYHTIFDIAQGIGEQPEFSAVPTKLVDKIINENWSGENYSKRIWANTDKLAEEVREVLTEAAVSGESISKTSRKIAEKFDTSAYNAQRLIRTETTYATNQAELLSYEELDIDKYEFVATLDTRTSTICQKMDGKVFKTEDAQAGKNLPAMHPNCRSTTIPYFKEGMPEYRTARDKDGKRIKVPADMKYDEWYKKYIEPYEKKKAVPAKPKEEKPKTETIERSEAYKTLTNSLEQTKIEKIPTKPLEKELTEQQIIDKLAGGDMTKGSCASLSLAYAGNKGGVDVIDFRGGESQSFFSSDRNLKEIAKLNGVKSVTARDTNDFKAVNTVLKDAEYNKEYILMAGKHAAVIKRIEGKGFEYLEMQNSSDNGYKKLSTDLLKKRFGCKKSHSIYGHKLEDSVTLIDRESLSNSNEFKELLSYINTPANAQKKGASGYAK